MPGKTCRGLIHLEPTDIQDAPTPSRQFVAELLTSAFATLLVVPAWCSLIHEWVAESAEKGWVIRKIKDVS
jgi:hypothetical protein